MPTTTLTQSPSPRIPISGDQSTRVAETSRTATSQTSAHTPFDIPEIVSFGLNIKLPAELETRTVGELLDGIRNGTWREPILRLRSLPYNSAEQKKAKEYLPFVIWSGVFSYKANNRLERHSGFYGIDIDGLSDADCTEALRDAVADKVCLAAYRSARGGGVRLLFRIPPCSAGEHHSLFEQVAEHVRNTYGHEPDPSGRDVSRASFVSFDEGLWCYPNALVLPVIRCLAHSDRRKKKKERQHRCVPRAERPKGRSVLPWARMGRFHMSDERKSDGTVFTHVKLLALGKAMALHASRIDHTLTNRDYNQAARAWFAAHERKGIRLRGNLAEYRDELRQGAEDARRKDWFDACADKWTRWARHSDFPVTWEERLLFAIRKHCEEVGGTNFFIGGRDAGLACKASFRTGARLLGKLVRSGKLRLLTGRGERRPFHAFEYRLIEAPSALERPAVTIISASEATQSATSGNTGRHQLPMQGGEQIDTATNQSDLNLLDVSPLSARLGALRR